MTTICQDVDIHPTARYSRVRQESGRPCLPLGPVRFNRVDDTKPKESGSHSPPRTLDELHRPPPGSLDKMRHAPKGLRQQEVDPNHKALDHDVTAVHTEQVVRCH